jgi:predicted HTH transcriptional regulator
MKTTIQLAKYNGDNRVELTENNEFGYCSLVKATKSVLDKIEIENKTFATITSKERKESRFWNSIALREAIINAFIHNDYTRELTPKFEIFDDRIEITSAGSLPEGLTESEFFEGFSIPRNKELMRVFKDLELVEQLGSGIPRILQYYGKESFQFTENFLRMTLRKNQVKSSTLSGGQISGQIESLIQKLSERQIEILNLIESDLKISRKQIADKLEINESAIQKHIKILIEKNIIERIGTKNGYWKILIKE